MLTPCIRYCKLNNEKTKCIGCFRSIEDIVQWRTFSALKQRSLTIYYLAKRVQNMIIFLDMDGVLSNFDDYVNRALGIEKDKHVPLTDEQWAKLPSNIFGILDPMPEAKQLIEYLEPYDNVQILTAIPPDNAVPSARYDKLMWMKNTFNFAPWKINVVYRNEKQLYATDINIASPNVLIDDVQQNISEWRDKGGAGILHTNIDTTLEELSKLGF